MRSTSPSEATCSRPDGWCCQTTRRACGTTPRSRGRTWGPDVRPRADRFEGAVLAVRLAYLGRGGVVAVRPQGLRRGTGLDVRADPVGDRPADRAVAAEPGRFEVAAGRPASSNPAGRPLG